MKAARILVVEDERIIARSLRKQLTTLGYEVVASVASGDAAIQQATELRPDLVLMDIRLEGAMDGVEAAAIIRKQFRLPVVYLTAHSNSEILERAKVTEPFGFILKPYDDRELHVVIETALYKHRMERRQQEREKWFVATLKSIGDAVVATDDEGCITYMNPLAERLTGWASQDALGQALNDVVRLVNEASRQPAESLLDQAMQDGTQSADYLLIAKDHSEKAVEDCVSLIADEHGRALGRVVVLRDVTWRKHLEEQHRQATKMEAIGRLAGGVAHDFNNLLTVINGYCTVLAGMLHPHDEAAAIVEEIEKASNRAAALTQQLLAYSRKQIQQLKVFNLNDLLANSTKMLARMIGEDVELVTALDPALHRVKVDPGQILQVLMNLAVNARDAMPTGGTLTIVTKNVRIDDAHATEFEMPVGPYVLLVVTDTGCGMDQETLTHIFEPFFTTKQVGQGTGLGLATAYGIVRQSDGHIKVHSEAGHGTTFKVYLPSLEEAGDSVAYPQEATKVPSGTESVLVAEDEEAVRSLTQRLLTQCGYKVLLASNGAEALEMAARHQGPIDLLLADVVMPKMGGRKLAEALRLARPEIRVLYLSGYTDDAVIKHGVQESEVAFLQKPFTLSALAQKVREVLGGKP